MMQKSCMNEWKSLNAISPRKSVMDFFLPSNILVIIRIEIKNDKPCYIVRSNSPSFIDKSNLLPSREACHFFS